LAFEIFWIFKKKKKTGGSIYEGDWVMDKCEGQGIIDYTDNKRYEGLWKNNNPYLFLDIIFYNFVQNLFMNFFL
jgi:hypothetical protein